MSAVSDSLRSAVGGCPRVALSLGSGLSSVARALGLEPRTNFAALGLSPAGVDGHSGVVSAGNIAEVSVVAAEGRLHMYEGHSLHAVTSWVRLAREAGAEVIVLTNAAGGLAPEMSPGDLMLIEDHISLPGLVGYPMADDGSAQRYPWPRFHPQDGVYSPRLRALATAAAENLGLRLRRGVYAMVHGTLYETPAERRFLRGLGADAVGMSTVPEASMAEALGAEVLAISVITNVAEPAEPPTHEEVTRMSQAAGPNLARLLAEVIAHIGAV